MSDQPGLTAKADSDGRRNTRWFEELRWQGKGRPGRAPQTAKREQLLGVDRAGCRVPLRRAGSWGSTGAPGKRWRHGRSITSSSGQRLQYAAVVDAKPRRVISARFLSESERERIADLRQAGEGVRAIATAVGRSPATVSRELRRNVEANSGTYRPHTAQRMAVQRRARPKTGKLVADVELREFVQDKLKRKWSPEQIAKALRARFPDQPDRHVVHETIYQAVYRPDLGGLSRELPKALRTGSAAPQAAPPSRGATSGRLPNMTMIDQRPGEAERPQRRRALGG